MEINDLPLNIATFSNQDGRFFNGLIGSITIYNRALTPSEIYKRSCLYQHNATLRSNNITIPTNKTWESFHCSRSVPDNTYLNVSIHDANTDEVLLTNINRTEELYFDISDINSIAHPSIYLQAYFQSNRTETPVLYDWAVNWTAGTNKIIPPELLENVPDILEVIEDTPENNIIDLAEYFSDFYSYMSPPVYGLQSDPGGDNITLSLDGSQIDVTHLADNWTGNVSVMANCTNIHGVSTSTNMFNIAVIPVDDAPAWNGTPPMITVKQGASNSTEYSLNDHVRDAEGDAWEFSLSSGDVNITAIVDEEDHIVITHSGDFTGSTSVTATVFQSGNHSLFSNISISVNVVENIPLDIHLLSPRNGTTITETDITLKWQAIYPEGYGLGAITFDLYCGENGTPSLYMSDIENENHTITDLKDNTTYYWYVIPSSENGRGICSDGIWSFMVNVSTVVPEVSYLTPPDGDTINTTSILLSWETENPLKENLSFDISVWDSKGNLTFNSTTENESHLLEHLVDNTTYYWKVIPWSARITGRSTSGVWHFTVKKDFIPVFNVSWSVDISVLRVKKGDTLSFNLTLNNTGNKLNTVIIRKEGELTKRAALSKTDFNLLPGASDMTNVLLFTSDFNVGEHVLTLKLVHGGGEESIEIPINITGETLPEPTPPGEKENYILTWVLGIVLLFTIGIVVLVLIRKRRKKEEEEDDEYAESDAIEADIVQLPVIPGQTQPDPQQPIEIPQVSPAIYDMRYQFKGRDIPSPLPPEPTPEMPAPPESFDISKISIPSKPAPSDSPVDFKQQFLALPPARFLEIKDEEQRVPIEELFLMTPGGLLVQHYSLQRETGLNEDVLASMLSAVKSFIMDSLSMLEKETGEESEVNRIDVGKYSVMMASGKSLALVAISSHEKKDIILDQIKMGANVLEEKFGEIMIDWDGDMSKVEGIKPYIESLVKGEFDLEALKRQTEGILPTPSEEKPELPTGLKTITIALPDPIKVPDTTRALPEKAETAPEEETVEKGTDDIIASLDDIVIGGEEPSVPETPPT